MAEPFIGQIMIVGFNFPPRGYASCDGQLVPISQNNALFSLLGTMYGGNGQTTFALPDLRGRCALHQGQGIALSARDIGETGGLERVGLTVNEIPAHSHLVNVNSGNANRQAPTGNVPAAEPTGQTATYSSQPPNATMSPQAIAVTGGGQSHDNMPPFLTLNFCIALQGIYPSRT